MRVKIIKCEKDPLMWYADKVNQDFEYLKEDSQGVWVKTDDAYGTSNWVYRDEYVMIV